MCHSSSAKPGGTNRRARALITYSSFFSSGRELCPIFPLRSIMKLRYPAGPRRSTAPGEPRTAPSPPRRAREGNSLLTGTGVFRGHAIGWTGWGSAFLVCLFPFPVARCFGSWDSRFCYARFPKVRGYVGGRSHDGHTGVGTCGFFFLCLLSCPSLLLYSYVSPEGKIGDGTKTNVVNN